MLCTGYPFISSRASTCSLPLHEFQENAHTLFSPIVQPCLVRWQTRADGRWCTGAGSSLIIVIPLSCFFFGQELLRMMFDVCTYQFVKLVVAIHQCIILLVERIEKFLFVTNAEAFLRSVLPCRMQPVAVGNEILVSTFHHVCRPVVSKQDEGVQGTFATVASNDFFLFIKCETPAAESKYPATIPR